MKVILPCCGSSSRFPGQPPKWTLPAHDGRPMLCLAIAGLEFSLDDLVVTILREHEATYHITAGLEEAFGRPVKMVILDQRTRSQSETVVPRCKSWICASRSWSRIRMVSSSWTSCRRRKIMFASTR